jgi:hypothetical protein
LNSVQALLLYNMGDSELTAGELKTRGLLPGLKRLLQPEEARGHGLPALQALRQGSAGPVRVSLTTKGLEARNVFQKLYQRQLGSVEAVGQITSRRLQEPQQVACPARALLDRPDPLSPVIRLHVFVIAFHSLTVASATAPHAERRI